jgi:short-subunit dehydrogenase
VSTSFWQGRKVWIVGASSGIGASLAKELQQSGATLALSARRLEPLQALAKGTDQVLPLDITNQKQLEQAHQHLLATWRSIDQIVWVAGNYVPMRADAIDINIARGLIETNLTSVYQALAIVLPPMIAAKQGAIALVSSVAGYSGLPKALAYGPTKAALINLAETLYIDLKPKGVKIQIINPGFVSTPLTAQNDFHMPALISPEQAAREIRQGLEGSQFEIHFPKRFSRFLKVMRLLPYRLYLPLAGLTGKQ